MTKPYLILEHSSPGELTELVCQHHEQGYRPHGSIICFPYAKEDPQKPWRFAQAVILNKGKK